VEDDESVEIIIAEDIRIGERRRQVATEVTT